MSTAAALLTAALERMPAGREQQAPPEPPLMLSGGPGGKDSGSLPRFFFRRHVETGAVGRELARTCHGVLRRSIADALPSNDDLDLLWDALCAAAPAAPGTDARRASFAQFCAASNNLGPKFKPYFRPSLFLCFGRDELGRIDALQFFNFVLRKVSLLQARVDLSAYDADYDGSLSETEMQTYIQEMMPLLNLRNMNPSFTKFYLCTAVRKFMFFLDPLRRGRVAIESILLSPILTELFELRDPDLPRDFEHSNWFSSYSALRVYGLFLNLDVDRNGMISRKELTKYRGESICRVFLDRVFQEYQTYSGEMDFNAFLDFVLAMENMHSVPSITYCFKLLDINGQGYLDRGSMTIFFRDIVARMPLLGQDPVPVDDVLNEIFDMANPRELYKVTLQGKWLTSRQVTAKVNLLTIWPMPDLTKCGMGGTIVSILCDYRGFHNYELRDQEK